MSATKFILSVRILFLSFMSFQSVPRQVLLLALLESRQLELWLLIAE